MDMDDEYKGLSWGYIKIWIKNGKKEGYPICCILWFCICPDNVMKWYAQKYGRDGYIPCPIHSQRTFPLPLKSD